MKKIFRGDQVKFLDERHVQFSGQKSIDLMEVAAVKFVNWFLEHGFDKSLPIFIYCGAGNNGGDGFAIARLLPSDFSVSVVKCFESDLQLSVDAAINFGRLPAHAHISILNWDDFPKESKGILIDAFLGVGLEGVLRPFAKVIIDQINSFEGIRISVDVPSGLASDAIRRDLVVKADFTCTFAFPKLALLFPEHSEFVGELEVLDIGILEKANETIDSSFFYIQQADIRSLHPHFHRFSHKGNFGKILLIGGSPGKMGALVLACKAALRTGSGLVTGFLDKKERSILQISIPEAMVIWDEFPDFTSFDAIGIGPGWGLLERKDFFQKLLNEYKKPVVIDADGLNLLSMHRDLISFLPPFSILTPHVGEFDRLMARTCLDHLERLELASEFAQKHQVILLLKGAHTVISLPDGRQLFNSTGTQYMATGGSGDVLTGMITSFLGMGCSPENAAILGVFHHGLAGELAGKKFRRSLIASDIIGEISATYFALDIR
jgi:NAD(P)H-hydrate epimerase